MKVDQQAFHDAVSDSEWISATSDSCKLSDIHTVEQFFAMHGVPKRKLTKFNVRHARKMVKRACDELIENKFVEQSEKSDVRLQWLNS